MCNLLCSQPRFRPTGLLLGALLVAAVVLATATPGAAQDKNKQPPIDEQKLGMKLEELGDDLFTVREDALKYFFDAGLPVLPFVEKSWNNPDPEIAGRLGLVVEYQALQHYLPGFPEDWEVIDLKALPAVAALSQRISSSDSAATPASVLTDLIRLTQNPRFRSSSSKISDWQIKDNLKLQARFLAKLCEKPIRQLSLSGVEFFNDQRKTEELLDQLELFPALDSLTLSRVAISNATVKQIASLKSLRELNFEMSPIKEQSALNAIAALPKLESLNLSVYEITDGDLKVLKSCGQLKSLSVLSKAVTDAGLAHIGAQKSLVSLSLRDCQVTDAGLNQLKEMKQLKHLALADTKVSDAGLAALKDLPALESLKLRGDTFSDGVFGQIKDLPALSLFAVASDKITDDGLLKLAEAKKLSSLNLTACDKVTDAGLANLKVIPKLKTLRVGQTKVTDAGLKHLKNLPGLSELDLSGLDVTDEGVRSLSGLKELESLNLTGTRIYFGWAKDLKELPKLTTLRLDSTGIYDGPLWDLIGATNLRLVTIRGTNVTPDGAQTFRNRMPKCKVLSE